MVWHAGPVLCSYAHLAASHLKIPDVSLLTASGPGFWDAAFTTHGGSAKQLCEAIGKNAANNKAVQEMRQITTGKTHVFQSVGSPKPIGEFLSNFCEYCLRLLFRRFEPIVRSASVQASFSPPAVGV